MGEDHALLVGLNYKNSIHELGGAENDAVLMKETLVAQCGVPQRNVVVVNKGFSTATIEAAVARANAAKAAQFWFFFAGHGQQVASKGAEEEDGKNECIVAGRDLARVSDDVLRRLLSRLHRGCTAIAIFDCCHSTSMLDLPHRAVLLPSRPSFKTTWVTVNQMVRPGGYRWYRIGARWRRYYARPVYRRRRVKRTIEIPGAPALAVTRHKQPGKVKGPRLICISAAQENQSSVGIKDKTGEWMGAFTSSLCAAMTPPRNWTVSELLRRIEADSRQKGIPQISSISSSTPLSASTHLFSIEPPPILLRRNQYPPSSS